MRDRRVFSANTGAGSGGSAVAPAATPGPGNTARTEVVPPPDPHAVNFETDNIWAQPAVQQQQQPTVVVQQQQQQVPMAERLQQHINGLQFPLSVSPEQAEKLGGVDVVVLNDVLQPMLRGVYQKALLDITTLMDRNSDKVRRSAVADAETNANTQSAIASMENTLVFTKHANVAPIARGVLGKFLAKGMPLDKAIGKVKEFFEYTANQTAQAGGNRIVPKGTPQLPQGGVGGFVDNGEGPTDWGTFFGIDKGSA